MSHKQVTLDLLQSVENDTHQNQKRRATKELGKLLLHIEQACESRHTSNQSKYERARQCDMIHDAVNEVSSILARTNTRNETVVTLHVLSHLSRIQRNGRIEICEKNNQDCKDNVVSQTCVV